MVSKVRSNKVLIATYQIAPPEQFRLDQPDKWPLAEHCGYGPLRDEMIQDRLLVGLRHARLSEKLQLDADLTLSKALAACQYEAVKKQQGVIRG